MKVVRVTRRFMLQHYAFSSCAFFLVLADVKIGLWLALGTRVAGHVFHRVEDAVKDNLTDCGSLCRKMPTAKAPGAELHHATEVVRQFQPIIGRFWMRVLRQNLT